MTLFFLRRRAERRTTPTSTLHHVLYGLLSTAVVIAICGSIWYVTRLPVFTIGSIHITGGETIAHEDIRSVVETSLYGNYFLLVPHRFVYLYPQERMLASVKEISRIRTVDIWREDRTNLVVHFEEYVPYALWCQDRTETAVCYFVDAEGYAFSKAPPLSGGAFTRHVIEGRTALEETQLFSSQLLQDIAAFMKGIEAELKLRVTEVTHTDAGDIVYHINGGGDLLTAKHDNVTVLFQNLKSILESEKFDHIEPGNFKYIDLRFGNKVFVNEELTPLDAATTTTASSTPGIEDL